MSKLPAPRDLFLSLHHHLICSDSHLMHAHASSVSSKPLSGQPTSSSSSSAAPTWSPLQSAAISEVEQVQLLCVRAMAEVYHEHAGSIGAMEGLPHLMKLLDLSLRRPLRHRLLLLVAAALQPRAAEHLPQVRPPSPPPPARLALQPTAAAGVPPACVPATRSSVQRVAGGLAVMVSRARVSVWVHTARRVTRRVTLCCSAMAGREGNSEELSSTQQLGSIRCRPAPQAQKAAKANAATFCDEGGVELLVDFAASAHETLDDQLQGVTGPPSGAVSLSSATAVASSHLLTAAGAPAAWRSQHGPGTLGGQRHVVAEQCVV